MTGKDMKAVNAYLDLNRYCESFDECKNCVFYRNQDCVQGRSETIKSFKKQLAAENRSRKR